MKKQTGERPLVVDGRRGKERERRTHTVVSEKANGDLNNDKLPRPYCGEIVFTDGGREEQLILWRRWYK
jgi:hypothetical protein